MAILTDHAELHGWPKGDWHEGEFFGQRKLLCAWDDVAALANEIGNYPGSIWPIAAYPWGTEGALARRIRFQPFDAQQLSASGYYADYDLGVLVVDYSTVGPVYFGGYMISEWLETRTDWAPVDYHHLAWGSKTGRQAEVNETPMIPYYGLRYIRKYHGLLSVPPGAMQYVGYCNANTLASVVLGLLFQPETLVYNGAKVQAKHQLGALPAYDVTYLFDWMPFNRNLFWDAKADNPDGDKGFWAPLYVKDPQGGVLKRYLKTVFF